MGIKSRSPNGHLSFLTSAALQESARVNHHGFSKILKIQNLPALRENGEIETLFKFHTMENMRYICNLASYHLENYIYGIDTQ